MPLDLNTEGDSVIEFARRILIHCFIWEMGKVLAKRVPLKVQQSSLNDSVESAHYM